MSVITVELQYRRKEGHYVLGIDDLGERRWFDDRRYTDMWVDGDKLLVRMDARKWRRRQGQSVEKRPTTDCKDRRCLMCRKVFRAPKNIFVCSTCKERQEWKDGLSIFDPV